MTPEKRAEAIMRDCLDTTAPNIGSFPEKCRSCRHVDCNDGAVICDKHRTFAAYAVYVCRRRKTKHRCNS